MTADLTPHLAQKTDTQTSGQPDVTASSSLPEEERHRPEMAPLATAETDGSRETDTYAAIRTAALAMSDAPAPTAAGEDSRDAAPEQPDADSGCDPDPEQTAIHDDSPDVLAAQTDDIAAVGLTDTPADAAVSDAAGAESPLPPDAATPTVPATGGNHGGQPPAQPPASDEETPDPDEKPMGLLDHLNEMRWRLVRCFIAAAVGFCLCWAFVEPIFAVLVKPLLAVLPAGGNAMYSTMPEAFFIRMFVACIAGLFVASPVIFYQIWAFISPGLYEEEKLFIVPVAVVSAVFFVGGALFCYHIVFPFAFQFFMSYNTEQIRVMPRISDYVDFVLKLLIAFGLIFEMPLFAFFLSRMGVLTAAMMRQARRYAILGIFIVAAILTPPDVLSQLLMAAPMLVLYEVSVIVAAVFGKKRRKAEDAADNAGDDDTGAANPPQEAQHTGERA